MNTRTNKIIYLSATVLLTALMIMSAGMYIFDYQNISESFLTLGYPVYIIYPLAIAKILGLVAIWSKKSKTLKEWAYAGFFFDIVLALSANINIGSGDYAPAVMALVLLMVSYFSEKED